MCNSDRSNGPSLDLLRKRSTSTYIKYSHQPIRPGQALDPLRPLHGGHGKQQGDEARRLHGRPADLARDVEAGGDGILAHFDGSIEVPEPRGELPHVRRARQPQPQPTFVGVRRVAAYNGKKRKGIDHQLPMLPGWGKPALEDRHDAVASCEKHSFASDGDFRAPAVRALSRKREKIRLEPPEKVRSKGIETLRAASYGLRRLMRSL